MVPPVIGPDVFLCIMGSFPLIDIEQVLADKMPAGKKVPRWAVWLLKKIIHQDWMNQMLKHYEGGGGLEFADATMKYLRTTIEPFGIERLEDRKYIFVSNHPLGGQDGVSLGTVVGSRFGEVQFIVNELLYLLPPLRPLIVPIRMGGRMQSRENALAIEQLMESDRQVIMFPAGICSRFQLDRMAVQDYEWKKSFVAQAVKYHRDVVPVYFHGHNSFSFYALAWIRRHLRIKANIEMLFLVHEMYKNQGKTFRAYFGKPIPWQTLASVRDQRRWANELRDRIYREKQHLAEW